MEKQPENLFPNLMSFLKSSTLLNKLQTSALVISSFYCNTSASKKKKKSEKLVWEVALREKDKKYLNFVWCIVKIVPLSTFMSSRSMSSLEYTISIRETRHVFDVYFSLSSYLCPNLYHQDKDSVPLFCNIYQVLFMDLQRCTPISHMAKLFVKILHSVHLKIKLICTRSCNSEILQFYSVAIL